MKKFVSFFVSLCIMLTCCTTVLASDNTALNINKDSISHDVSEYLYGISMDEDNLANDGGLVSNMVSNGSFEYADDTCPAWELANAVTLSKNDTMSENNENSAIIHCDNKSVTIKNTGYDNMTFEENEKYEFSLYARNISFSGTIGFYLDSKKNSNNIIQVSDGAISSNGWTYLHASITSSATEDGSLAIVFDGDGEIAIDMVSLVPQDSYGYGSDEWKYTSLRSDMVEGIKALKPSFIRFSVGSSAKTNGKNDYYSWKDTIGALDARRQYKTDKSEEYMVNTAAMGYHEYFQLCADLGARAVPVVGADMLAKKPGSDAFTNYVQDVLDLVEYANGDSVATYWGALRAMNGHQQPFNIKYIGIGNDSEKAMYEESFSIVQKAINEKYPDVTVIRFAGNGEESTMSTSSDYIIDEHYLTSDDFMLENGHRFDGTDRDSKGIMVGSYSCNNGANISSSVEECSFLTGIERNSDIVTMAAYSPVIMRGDSGAMMCYDKLDLAYSPSYYAQMIFANNTGLKHIDTNLDSEDVSESVTIDENSQMIYIKLVNSSSSKEKITVNLNGFGDISLVSNISVGYKYKDAYNSIGKQTVAPEVEDIESSVSNFDITLGGNSVNVIRVAYGENDGAQMWTVPEGIDTDTSIFFPNSAKVLMLVVVVGFLLGSGIGFVAYRKIAKKNRRKDNDV